MANTITPSQIGYNAPGSRNRSEIYLGRNTNVEFEAIGLGKNYRPDELQALKIHISRNNKSEGAIYIDIEDILNIKQQNAINSELFLKLREASVCVINENTGESEEKKIIILSTEPF
jgi:hypothetical protein